MIKSDLSLRHANNALRINPLCVPALDLKSACLAYLGRVPDALKCIDFAIGSNPKYEHVYVTRAAIYRSNNRVEKALIDLEAAFSLGLSELTVVYDWGNVLLDLYR